MAAILDWATESEGGVETVDDDDGGAATAVAADYVEGPILPEPVCFGGPDREWGELSNGWHLANPIAGADGLRYPTAEHAFWGEMYTHPLAGNATRALRALIAAAPSPLAARYYANGVPAYRLRRKGGRAALPRWLRAILACRAVLFARDEDTDDVPLARAGWDTDAVQIDAMQRVLRAKFETNDAAAAVLAQTNLRPIHAMLGPYESKWGAGNGTRDPDRGVGQNLLGAVLMGTRHALLEARSADDSVLYDTSEQQ